MKIGVAFAVATISAQFADFPKITGNSDVFVAARKNVNF